MTDPSIEIIMDSVGNLSTLAKAFFILLCIVGIINPRVLFLAFGLILITTFFPL